MKDLGDIHYFLGLQIVRDESTFTVTQTRYLLSLLQKFGFDGAKPVSTPLASGSSMSATDGVPLADPSHYRCLVGSLQYLTLTRPSILFAVHHVCRFMQAPHDTHLIAVKRIFRYLKGHSMLDFTTFAVLFMNFVVFVTQIGLVVGMTDVPLLGSLSF
jgi:histone deacetylase 1/2